MIPASPSTAASHDAAPPALQAGGISLRLGDRAVLRDIALTLQRGQTLALLGPSGCGKTSLLRVIAGLIEPESGTLQIAGRSVTGLPPQQRGVGMMFQHYALFPNLTVADNIAFGPLAQGWSAARAAARTAELLALIDLNGHASKRPGQLSGGQRQRVAMARALAPQPALLLMDEPFSAIDESFRLPLRRAFKALQRGLHQSCVVVTHDREEAFELADVVGVMLDGQLVRLDTPAQLLRQPGTLAVARFLGAFNVFEQLPRPLARQVGAPEALVWAAPMSSLQLSHDVHSPDAWDFEAVVTARHPGLRLTQLELRLDDGTTLQMVEGRQPILPGERRRFAQPLAALAALQPD